MTTTEKYIQKQSEIIERCFPYVFDYDGSIGVLLSELSALKQEMKSEQLKLDKFGKEALNDALDKMIEETEKMIETYKKTK